jgi:hypothetical protein
MAIVFDESNLLAQMVGEADGITPEELSAAEPLAAQALAGVKALTESGAIGFPNLPKQTGVANEIVAYAEKVKGSYDTVCLVGIGGSRCRETIRRPSRDW